MTPKPFSTLFGEFSKIYVQYTAEKYIWNKIVHKIWSIEIIVNEKIGLLPNIDHANPAILFSKHSGSSKKKIFLQHFGKMKNWIGQNLYLKKN